MNLIPFVNPNGLELVIDQESGASFASVRAIARMVDKNESTIRSWVGTRNISSILAEIQTEGGIQGARLFDEEVILAAFEKYKPEGLMLFARAGLRVYLHKLAGYEVKSTAVKQPEEPKVPKGLKAARSAAEIYELLEELNPRLCSYLVDHTVNEVLEQSALSPSEGVLRGVVEIAEEMNLPVNISNRGQLGKFVKAAHSDIAQQERRMVNGTYRDVWCYPDTEEVRQTVQNFFQ